MSRSAVGASRRLMCFPRVSGDEPSIGGIISAGLKFSPRERG